MAGLDGRVVAITGATGRLGGVVARRFAEAGARLAVLGRSTDEAATLAAALPGGTERHIGVAADLGDAASAAAAAGIVRERLGPTSGLLHLVGGYAGGRPFVENDAAEMSRLLELN